MEISVQTHEFIQAEAASVDYSAQLLSRLLFTDNTIQRKEHQNFIVFQRHGQSLEFFPDNLLQYVAYGKDNQSFIPKRPSLCSRSGVNDLFFQIPYTQQYGYHTPGVQLNGQHLHIPIDKCFLPPVFPADQLQHKLPAQSLQVIFILFNCRPHLQDLLRLMKGFQKALRRQIIFYQIINGIMLQHISHIFVIVVTAQTNRTDFRILRRDPADQLIPVHLVHLNICYHNIGMQPGNQGPGLFSVAAFPTDAIAFLFPVDEGTYHRSARQLVIYQ